MSFNPEPYLHHWVLAIEAIRAIPVLENEWQKTAITNSLTGELDRLRVYKREPFPEFINIIDETNRRLNEQ